MKFWEDCADSQDMLAMWSHEDVRKEWIAAGEAPGSKVHLLRNPDGQYYLTQTEMRAVAEIIVGRFFKRRLDPAMICAIAEIESDRQPLTHRYDPKLKESFSGLMQVLQSTAEWLAKELGFTAYAEDLHASKLYKPFAGVYYGAAYLKWLTTFGKKKRSEEFVVRAYHSGPKNATTSHSSLQYWEEYLTAKQNLPHKSEMPTPKSAPSPTAVVPPSSPSPGRQWIYWEELTSAEDMAEMWRRPEVKKEWTKGGEKHSKARLARDAEMRPYITRKELKAVAEIVVSRYFGQRGVSPAMLCALAEITSKRMLFGDAAGLMRLPYSTACWLYSELGYKSYKLKGPEDLCKPFVAIYFAAACICWLSNYKGRTRSDQFIVQAYRQGPQFADSAESGLFWLKYMDALPEYLAKAESSTQAGCVIQ